MKRWLDEMQGRVVVVHADGFDYRGILREVTQERVCLQGLTGRREIRTDRIARIELAERLR